MNLIITGIIMLTLSCATAFGQEVENSNQFEKAKIGTYQIRLSSYKFEYAYTEETLIYFEANRKENEDVTIQLNSFTSVFLPSKSKITSTTFKPLSEIIYQ